MRQLMIIVLWAAISLSVNALTKKNTNRSKESTKMENQDNVITAQALCDAFMKDQAKAQKEYGNRIMKITGVARFVGPDIYTLPSVELAENKEAGCRALCVLPFSDYLKLRKVSKGDEVIMEGEVRGFHEKDKFVVVKECKIVTVNKK